MFKEKIIIEMKEVFKEIPFGIEHTLKVLKNAEDIMKGENIGGEEKEFISNANQELKSLKSIAAAMFANTWNKRPVLERTKEAVWMWNFEFIQLKKDSIGWRRRLTAVEYASPDFKVSPFFCLFGVTIFIPCSVLSVSAHSESQYALSANSQPLRAGGVFRNIIFAAVKSKAEAFESISVSATGREPALRITSE